MNKKGAVIAVFVSVGGVFPVAGHAESTDFLTRSEAALRSCQADYKMNVAAANLLSFTGRLAREDAAVQGRSLEESASRAPATDTDPIPRECMAKGKQELMPDAKKFIAAFKQERVRSKAREVVAQWMTAMDSVGSPVADQEAAKFATLANELRLEN